MLLSFPLPAGLLCSLRYLGSEGRGRMHFTASPSSLTLPNSGSELGFVRGKALHTPPRPSLRGVSPMTEMGSDIVF